MRTRYLILRVLKWLAVGVPLLLLALFLFIVFMPSAWLRGVAGSKGSAALGREFSIAGPVRIGWSWSTPEIDLHNVRLANMPGESPANMVDIGEVDFHIKIWDLLRGRIDLPDLVLTKPQIVLERTKDGKANWDFPALSKANVAAAAAVPKSRFGFPVIGRLAIAGGSIEYKDAPKNLDLKLSVDTVTGRNGNGGGMFNLKGDGTLQGRALTLAAQGGSLDMLRGSTKPWPLNLHVTMGDTKVAVDGTFTDPVKMQGVDARLDLSGGNLADLFYLTSIPLPPTPAYSLGGHLTRDDDVWKFAGFKGRVGDSDLEGDLSYDTSGKRGAVTANLASNLLRMKDLGGFIGKSPDKPKPAGGKLIPDVPIDLGRMRATDMDVTLKARRIDQGHLPLDNLTARFLLKNGVLKLDPLRFGVAGGELSGPVTLDGSSDVPVVTTDLLLHRLSLQPFFKNSRFAAFSSGHFGGRFTLKGRGKSLAAVLADANGRITLVMSGGALSRLIVAAAGLDVPKAAPALLGDDESTPVRCAIGDFGVTDGLLKSDIFVLDTGVSNIHGHADINLRDQTIQASVEAHPKSPTIAAPVPITVNGPLNAPAIGIDPTGLAARGAAAAALSAVLTPLAAVVPFINLGLGKDSNCHALVEEAKAHAAAAPAAAAHGAAQ